MAVNEKVNQYSVQEGGIFRFDRAGIRLLEAVRADALGHGITLDPGEGDIFVGDAWIYALMEAVREDEYLGGFGTSLPEFAVTPYGGRVDYSTQLSYIGVGCDFYVAEFGVTDPRGGMSNSVFSLGGSSMHTGFPQRRYIDPDLLKGILWQHIIEDGGGWYRLRAYARWFHIVFLHFSEYEGRGDDLIAVEGIFQALAVEISPKLAGKSLAEVGNTSGGDL